ncbi:MAG TPA: hypothetical protein VFT50_14020 [Baekduia sp.]|nr:hypothetical protein [Baekduia sp.]
MTDQDRVPEEPGVDSSIGGENADPSAEKTHTGAPHDRSAREPLGPLTPDDERPLGDTPEAHDEIIPEDLPKGHPGRAEAERRAAEGEGVVRGST